MMSRTNVTLGSRFALLFAGTLAATALVVYLFLSFLASRQSERQAQQSVLLASQVMSRLMKTQADALQVQCELGIRNLALDQLAAAPERNTVDDTLQELLSKIHVDAAAMVGRQGQLLGTTHDMGDSSLQQSTLTQSWSGIVVTQGQPRLMVVTPIRDTATQEQQAALLTYRNLDNRLAQQLAEALQARITFHLDGKVVAISDTAPNLSNSHDAEIHSRTVLPEDTTGGRLTLQLSLPRRALLAGLDREREGVLIAFLSCCVLGLLLAVRLAHQLTYPLEEVIVAAQQVREGVWPEPLPVHGQGELRLLQAVFNDMTATLRANQLVTVQTLAAAVDARDAYTRGHSDRVANYAQRLAKAFELPDELVERIHTIGTLHDVGKIGIPDAILLKPGALSAEERTIMESHAVRSEEIIRNVPALAAMLPGIRHHHERWDGRGYPDGLVGENIPLEARILAIADTFDALTSDRPYRRGWTFARALSEIERCIGTQFDPALTTTFLALWSAEVQGTEQQKVA